jgi:hypothetical protein
MVIESCVWTQGAKKYSMSRLVLTLAVLLFSAQLAAGSDSYPSCVDVLLSPRRFAGVCQDSWETIKPILKPTQSDIGFAWVARKAAKNFKSTKDAQKEMDDGPVPVLLGPVEETSASVGIYITDDHHTLAALDYSGYTGITLTVVVECDFRGLDLPQFWSEVSARYDDYTLVRDQSDLAALPLPIDPASELPSSFAFTAEESSFGDDPYRALAGYSRKVVNEDACADASNDDCMRCFQRVCDSEGNGIPYIEFSWAYYFNVAIDQDPYTWWPSVSSFTAFEDAWQTLARSSLSALGDVDVDAWGNAAGLIVPLCRSNATATFEVPVEYFGYKALPGYANESTQLPKDPECATGGSCAV